MCKANSPSNGSIDGAYDHGISLWTALIVGFCVILGMLSFRRSNDEKNGAPPTLPGKMT